MVENGAGKTTLMEVLMGVRAGVSGELSFWNSPNPGNSRAKLNKKVECVTSTGAVTKINLGRILILGMIRGAAMQCRCIRIKDD